jgi:two-component system NarL family sensor kinase
VNQCVELTVEDDGVGFDAEEADPERHFGLGLMKERVERVRGTLKIESRSQRGTRLTAALPLQPRSEVGLD